MILLINKGMKKKFTSAADFGFRTYAVREVAKNHSTSIIRFIWLNRSVFAITIAAVAFSSSGLAFANHDPFNGTPQTSVQICHATGNPNNWVQNSPSVSATGGNFDFDGGHGGNTGTHGADIIPPFHFDDGENILSFPGKNWTASNQDRWNNGGCDGDGIVTPDPETASLTLVKALAGDDTADEISDWKLSADGPTDVVDVASGTTSTVDVGTYNLSEFGPVDGYTPSGWVCLLPSTSAPNPATMTDGDTVVLTANQNVTCTITNTYDDGGGNQPADVTVTIVKYIGDSIATANSAGGASFSMTATWSATNIGSGSGGFELDADGFLGGPEYQATTSSMSSGANYSVQENLDTVCELRDDFALVGYSVGDSLSAAEAAAVSSTAPNLTNITTNKFIIVHNQDCSVPPTYSISGKIYHDNNSQNGQLDEGENGLENWRAYIDLPVGEGEGNNVYDPEEPTDLSDSRGNYVISGLEAGCYTVREVLQDGWNQTDPTVDPDGVENDFEYEVAVGPNQNICNPVLLDNVVGFFFKTAHAAVVDPNVSGLNFGNIEEPSSGGGGGSRRSGSSSSDDDDGRILGDFTGLPYVAPQPEVAGATTTLPRTGVSTNSIGILISLLAVLALPVAITRKMRQQEDS